MRREGHSERYLGNTNKKEVHDLDNEKTKCQIDAIVRASHAVYFSTHAAATTAEYDNCAHCIGDSES